MGRNPYIVTIDQAKGFQMTQGKYKGVELSKIPLHYLKWLAKNWVYKEVRDAAVLVVNVRAFEVGEKLEYKPTYKVKIHKPKVQIDYANGAFGKLKEELDVMPEGLF